MNQLGTLEEAILLITMYLDEAYGVSVAEEYKKSSGSSISIPAVHTVLRRMEEKGYVRSKMGEASAQRGGKRKRIYEATAFGFDAIRQIKDQRMKLWSKIPELKTSGSR